MTKDDLEDLGYCVICAANAAEALEVLEVGTAVAVLFTDIRMPGPYDGWELARRARELRPDLPVLYASGFSGEGPHPVAGSVFLHKPYRLREVEAALGQLLPA